MIENFNDICIFRQRNPGVRGSGIRVNDPKLVSVKKSLQFIQDELRDSFQYYKGILYNFDYSKGQAFFPSILHATILPPAQKVSSGIYVVICFDIMGRGALVGCAESKTHPQGLNTVKRTNKKELKIDVDGLRITTKYNNVFENPKEFAFPLTDEETIFKHIKKSIDLALYHLNLDPNPDLDILELVNTKYKYEFDPQSIYTAKEIISTNIVRRRGQKIFRERLLVVYNGRCAITGCIATEVLEACHIVPFNGEDTNTVQNGMLLRADLHLLFDLGLILVNPDDYTIVVNDSLRETEYYQYNGIKLFLPSKEHERPSKRALLYHIKENST